MDLSHVFKIIGHPGEIGYTLHRAGRFSQMNTDKIFEIISTGGEYIYSAIAVANPIYPSKMDLIVPDILPRHGGRTEE